MKRLFLFLLFAVGMWAQQPNCQINFSWTDVATSPVFNNIGVGTNNQCTYWVLNYQVSGFSAISLHFESATGATTAGAFSDFTGTVTSGINPSTSVVCATVANCTAVFTGAVGWYRVRLASHTGNGTITGTLKGYITGYFLGGNSPPTGSGCPGTVGTPCVVVGNVAAGAVAAGSPVQVAGVDMGGDVRRIITDGNGGIGIASASNANADGVSNTQVFQQDGFANDFYTRTMASWFNGSTWDRYFACTNQAVVTISAGTDAVLVSGVAATNIRICHIDFGSDTVATFTIRQGTGSMCGTNTATLAGPYPSILTFADDFAAQGALRTTVAARDLCLHSSASVTVGGIVTYAQF